MAKRRLCLWIAALALSGPPPGRAAPPHAEVSDAAGLIRAAAKMGEHGGTIRLRPGVYVLTAPLRFSRAHHVNLVGDGWDTALQTRGAIDAIVFDDCSFCTVRHLLVNGDEAAPAGSGILFRGQCSSCTVDFCRLSSFAQSGVRFEGEAASPQSSNVVSRCHLIDNGGDQLYSRYNNDFHILNNQFGAHRRQKERAPRSGACLDRSSAGNYSGNFHWGNRVALRMSPGCNFNRIENNRFEESREQGILMGDPSRAAGLYLNILTGNTIHTNSQDSPGKFAAVEAYGACDVTFCANQVFSWDSARFRHRASLDLGRGCKTWIVTGNHFRHHAVRAILYDPGAGHVFGQNIDE